ncbi:ABC transporter permease [Roseivirga sp.]|uniref:ABC transporter permease n=1 Tax=Roseivirga sp. TaxID=1964215 RepID=UPI003B8C3492
MLKNYILVAYRSLIRDKFFSLLNLFGLTIGITAFLLIGLYVKYELSFDKFHSKRDRIYAYKTLYYTPEGTSGSDKFSLPAGSILKENVPEIEEIVQLTGGYKALINVGNETFYDENWYYSNNSLFKTFDFEVITGAPNLEAASSVVITESMALKLFGDKNPIGELIQLNKTEQYYVSAIAADPPKNSYIQFSMIFSNINLLNDLNQFENEDQSKWGTTANTYFLKAEGASEEQMIDKMRSVGREFFGSRFFKDEDGTPNFEPSIIPYEDIYLKSKFTSGISPTGDIRYVYLFSSIAVLILLIACVNYINLATAKSLKRAKETGLRKVIGADKNQLLGLYLTESIVLTTISVFIAFALAERILPAYNDLIDRSIELSYGSIEFLFTIIVINLSIGVLAGLYPSIKLSRFKPVDAIRGARTAGGKKSVRRGLVFFQFLIAQMLIVVTIVIQSQLSYLQNKDLGYNREQALYINTYEEFGSDGEVFKTAVDQIPTVESSSYSSGVFTRAAITFFQLKEVEGNEDDKSEEYIISDLFEADEDFIDMMEIEMVLGRKLDKSVSADVDGAIIINEAAVKKFGWEENPLGKKLKTWGRQDRIVVGVMKDFHNESLKAEITPTFVVLNNKSTQYLNIRILPDDMSETIAKVESIWSELVPDRPLEYTFYDDKFDQHYQSERRLGKVFFIFASLAIGISLLGLIGLTAFTAEQRLKEIGIRKVLGASVKQLILLLSKEFVILSLVAFFVAVPISYYIMDGWLTEFKYRIDITLTVYAIAIVASIGVSWLVVCFQSIKVARNNPTNILRME